MGNYFDQVEVFPIIARVINEKYRELNRYVTHEEIAEGLLKDDEGQHEIEKAYQRSGNRSRDWLADNMIAWFSQKITAGQSTWDRHFERTQIKGKWAYKPVQNDSQKT